ncbi:hypothetical protein OY671_010396, partial [Metschnikowia pulcherrima]
RVRRRRAAGGGAARERRDRRDRGLRADLLRQPQSAAVLPAGHQVHRLRDVGGLRFRGAGQRGDSGGRGQQRAGSRHRLCRAARGRTDQAPAAPVRGPAAESLAGGRQLPGRRRHAGGARRAADRGRGHRDQAAGAPARSAAGDPRQRRPDRRGAGGGHHRRGAQAGGDGALRRAHQR